MKTLPAILFALGVTAVVAVAMVIIGSNALVNPNTVPVTNAPSSNVAAASYTSSSQAGDPPSSTSAQSAQSTQLAQLQALVTQYQSRETQYQSELNQAIQELNNANAQLQQDNQEIAQFQQLLQVMQQDGLITVTSDGRIFLGSGGRR
jgi:flagellar motor protein MotB